MEHASALVFAIFSETVVKECVIEVKVADQGVRVCDNKAKKGTN